MLSLCMNNFAIKRTPCINNVFRIWSFLADFYFDIKTQKEKNMRYFCVRVYNKKFKYIFSRPIINLLQKYILESLDLINGLILS